jgi:hypothetical protein
VLEGVVMVELEGIRVQSQLLDQLTRLELTKRALIVKHGVKGGEDRVVLVLVRELDVLQILEVKVVRRFGLGCLVHKDTTEDLSSRLHK